MRAAFGGWRLIVRYDGQRHVIAVTQRLLDQIRVGDVYEREVCVRWRTDAIGEGGDVVHVVLHKHQEGRALDELQ